MHYQKRILFDHIQNDLAQKMVFLGGPRQVGKTTLSKQFLDSQGLGYLNWDIAAHREKILKQEFPDV
jgi:predicted AAA+ superfamily ATPase